MSSDQKLNTTLFAYQCMWFCVQIWGGGWQTIRQEIVEMLLVIRSLTHNRSMQEPLLCSCIGLYEATLFCRPDPDPKVCYITAHSSCHMFNKSSYIMVADHGSL